MRRTQNMTRHGHVGMMSVMRELWRRVKANWNRTDTVLAVINTLALAAFIGNCWWESVWVCHLALALPLLVQLVWARHPGDALRRALLFGAILGWAWPLGEGLFVRGFGWWGEYLAPGPRIWDTPVYCVLVGWLAAAHIHYWSRRVIDIGYRVRVSVGYAAVTAFVLGLAGENLFVAGGIWSYDASVLDWWSVPAFVPVAYAIGFGVTPLVVRRNALGAFLVVSVTLYVACVGLGFATGFLPR